MVVIRNKSGQLIVAKSKIGAIEPGCASAPKGPRHRAPRCYDGRSLQSPFSFALRARIEFDAKKAELLKKLV